jgi:uroporphyrin-III C-methyltransferase / precorrin-2 dehydrogenase / sirohydrochlorin ferrochelatase
MKVVRLKGGDPMIFGRVGEEIAALQAAGIAVEVVPGVTAASGAAARLNVSLTQRDVARRLQFVTCHAKDGALPDDLDWAALADPAATTAIYMGVKTLPAFVERAMASGLAPATPVAVVERATWADERLIAGTLDTIVQRLAVAAPKGPCIVLVGEAMRGTVATHTTPESCLEKVTSP